jgi:5,10-methylenetetrahydrofolate reductase
MKAGTNLEKILESGRFAVTAEAGPPKGTSCVLLKEQRIEPVMQMVCRDRNRIAIQSDVLTAVALDIHNILCISGDHQSFGNHPAAKGVFDIDSIQLIQTLRKMRDEKKFINNEDIAGEVPLFIGAAANPFADPFDFRVTRLFKKIEAGADFIQTQAVYNVPKFSKWMEMVTDRGLDKRTHILAGVIPIRSAGMARYMKEYVAGVEVPDDLLVRMQKAENAKEEGVKIILEIIEQLKEIEGVHGIHIMAVGWEEIVPEIAEKAGLMPRPIL